MKESYYQIQIITQVQKRDIIKIKLSTSIKLSVLSNSQQSSIHNNLNKYIYLIIIILFSLKNKNKNNEKEKKYEKRKNSQDIISLT